MERWKDIEGYGGRYKISDRGRIKSYAQDTKSGKIHDGFETKKGYKSVCLYKDKTAKRIPVHRLVAQAFIPNPNNLPQVNHIDEDKHNNSVENLEWCDNDYNAHYGNHFKNIAMANRCCETTSVKVYSVSKDGSVEHFDSIGEAERQTGLSHCNIVRTLKGRTHHCGEREWYYEPPTTTERTDA